MKRAIAIAIVGVAAVAAAQAPAPTVPRGQKIPRWSIDFPLFVNGVPVNDRTSIGINFGAGAVCTEIPIAHEGVDGPRLSCEFPGTASTPMATSTASNTPTITPTPAPLDHGGLAGLADDDHAQYALLTGRTEPVGPFGSQGQTLFGSSADGPFETLILNPNPSGVVGGFTHALGNLVLGLGNATIKGLYAPILYSMGPVDIDASAETAQINAVVAGSLFGPLTVVDDTQTIIYAGFTWAPDFQGSGKSLRGGTAFEANPHFAETGSGSEALLVQHVVGYRIEPRFEVTDTGASTAVRAEELTGVYDFPDVQQNTLVGSRVGYFFRNRFHSGTQQTAIGLYVADQDVQSQAWSLLSPGEAWLGNRGQAIFGSSPVASSSLAADIDPGDTTITLTSSAAFAAAGVVEVNDLFYTYTANNTGTGELTLSLAAQAAVPSSLIAHQYALPIAQVDTYVADAARIGHIVQGAASQTASLTEWRDSGGNTLTAIDANGFLKPKHSADAGAPNDSLYYSTDAAKLVYKDGGGTVHALY